MSRRSLFLFGLGFGAWLNIWPPAIHPAAGFVFAYALVAIAFASNAWSHAPTPREEA